MDDKRTLSKQSTLTRCIRSDTLKLCIRFSEQTNLISGFPDFATPEQRPEIVARIRSAGSLGDVKPVGEGVSEMRVHYGPGYRIYFKLRGKQLIILLIGGDKSTQKSDITKAKALAAALEE